MGKEIEESRIKGKQKQDKLPGINQAVCVSHVDAQRGKWEL